MHREAPLRVGAAHVDALDRTCLCALETGLALQRAVFVGNEFESAAVAWSNVWFYLWIHDGALRLEEARERQAHP